MKQLTTALAVLFLMMNSLRATTYYISNMGDDANNGTSTATPWKTLTKLSAELGGTSGTWGTISTGDQVYFRRGDVFRGSIAFSAYNNDGITFDAYGSGATPIIKGSTVVTNWTVHSGNIWKATVTQRVYFLYQNAAVQTLARAPNTDTWNASTSTTTSMTSSSIGSAGLDFVGANICIREYDWRLNRQIVTAQSSNTVNWVSAIEGTPQPNANFYFDNKLNLLDAVGEWFWDSATNTLYYKTDGTDPNTLTMEASVNLLGIAGNDNRSNNTFQNLTFAHFAQEGIRLMGSANNNVIQNCTFSHNFQALFVSGNSSNIQNNTITDSYYQGAVLANMANGTFSNNSITDVGMTFGQHRPDFSGDFYSGGVWLINGNTGCVIGNNTITNIGNIGIRFNGVGITVEKNQVTNVMVNMDDGGGIYTWGGNNSSHDNTIRNNIVNNLVGSHNGTGVGSIINGIYIDNDAYAITIQNNTVQNMPDGSAIIINAGAYNCVITNNVTYKCKQGLGFYDWQSGQSIHSNTASGNTFYANVTGAIPIEIASNDNNHNVMSASNNNFLVNPYGTSVGRYIWSNVQTFTMAQWRTTTGYDAASVGSYYSWTYPTDNSFLVINNTTSPTTYNYTNVKNLDNQTVNSLTLQPFTSQVLIQNTVLPVELLDFTGKYIEIRNPVTGDTEGGNLLSWTTAHEINNKGFQVERLQPTGGWDVLGFVAGKGKLSTYDFLDVAPPSGAVYYRLRQIDNDGKETFSKIISIATKGNSKLKIYPNPVSNTLTIETDFVIAPNEANCDFQILNLLGQQVLYGKTLPSGTGAIDVSALPQGSYVLKMGAEQVKFVKQ